MKTLIADLKQELAWFLAIFIVVSWTLMGFDIYHRYTTADQLLTTWEYATPCTE